MKLNIHYFASIREQLGVDEQRLELEGDSTVADLIAVLIQTEPKFSAMIEGTPSILIAVNQTVVERNYTLSEDDEVAFFPPMTGG